MPSSLNLIRDSWIPVTTTAGCRTIRPADIADPAVLGPDWPRADLNLACLELLIGLVAAADPPEDAQDWEERQVPDPTRLEARLEALALAFELLGEGPRFLQELGGVEGEGSPPDMLFIDSAGANAARNNADLMVRRGRYPVLDLAMAAMALYTLQAHAPLGGAGNRTSMRGGGPMVTPVDPGTGRLWDLVWANVPNGAPAALGDFPWMRPTRTSEGGRITTPADVPAIEAFFGMPRRLRLVEGQGGVAGVIQRPWGTNYAGWQHPLTPHYRMKPGSEILALHPRAGAFGYRNWLGVVMADGSELRTRAACVATYEQRVPVGERSGASVLVGGWAMDNMKPRDFVLSRQPLPAVGEGGLSLLRGMVQAAEIFGDELRQRLKPVAGEKSALEALREAFFIDTQPAFDAAVSRIGRADGVAEGWLAVLERAAMAIFDREALPGLPERPVDEVAAIVGARRALQRVFAGWQRPGVDARARLGLQPRPKPVEKELAA